MNKYYWKIGRIINSLQNKCNNPCEYVSNYLSYYFGNSNKFNRENIKYMEKFFYYFPFYFEKFNILRWNQFKVLLNINNNYIRNFYLKVALFCNSNEEELKLLINNKIVYRI